MVLLRKNYYKNNFATINVTNERSYDWVIDLEEIFIKVINFQCDLLVLQRTIFFMSLVSFF